jgi:hypothetical protein
MAWRMCNVRSHAGVVMPWSRSHFTPYLRAISIALQRSGDGSFPNHVSLFSRDENFHLCAVVWFGRSTESRSNAMRADIP